MGRELKTLLTWLFLLPLMASAFAPIQPAAMTIRTNHQQVATTTNLKAVVPDLDTIALVAGQENIGLAIVLMGEAVWSFVKGPSVDHGIKTLLPASVAAVVLAVVSGPMITSGEASSVATGLWIATGISVAMGGVYLARCLAPFSPSPKEIPAAGVLVAFAGFFSFSQNLVIDGFLILPEVDLSWIPNPSSIPSLNDLPF
jgi:hypothetical protein